MTGVVSARVEEFIGLRRGLGYRSPSQERALRGFGRHLDQSGHEGPIPLESSLDWATSTASTDPCNPARRLTVVRGFLRHLAAIYCTRLLGCPQPQGCGPTATPRCSR